MSIRGAQGEGQPERGRITRPARLYLYGSALVGAAHTVSWTLLARYFDEVGFTKTQIGDLQSADSWGKVLVAIPAALFLARRPAAGVFVAAALVGGLAYAVLPWLESFHAVYIANLVAGFSMTLHYVAIAPFLFRHTGTAERARVFGLAEAVRTLAAVVGAVAAGRFVASFQDRLGGEAGATGWVITGAGALSACAALFYMRIQDPRPELTPDQTPWKSVRRHRGILARFAAPQFMIACGAGFCIPFLPLYFKDRFDFGPGAWGNLFAGGQVLMSVGFLSTPWLLARLGFVRSIVAIELLSIPFFLLLAYTFDVRLAMLGFLMRGALMNATHPLHKNLMMQATPAGAREVQTGINATLWGVGWVVGPLLAGRVLDATNDDYRILMLSTVGIYLVAASLNWLLLRPLERRLAAAPPAPVLATPVAVAAGSVGARPSGKDVG